MLIEHILKLLRRHFSHFVSVEQFVQESRKSVKCILKRNSNSSFFLVLIHLLQFKHKHIFYY